MGASGAALLMPVVLGLLVGPGLVAGLGVSPARAQDPGAIRITNGATAQGVGMTVLGGLDSAPSDNTSSAALLAPLAYGRTDTGISLVGALGSAAPSAQPGDIRLQPIDTNRLIAPSLPAGTAPTVLAAPAPSPH
ncbi:organic solvent tolerance protein, partial [Rhodospirillum rubrum]|nr:organic solvent tolerance protein [Rhodospirillum rubrum]